MERGNLRCACGQTIDVPPAYAGPSISCPCCGTEVCIDLNYTAGQDPPARKRIGEILVDGGLITNGQLDQALKAQHERGGKLVEILIDLGFIEITRFVEFLHNYPGVTNIDLAQFEVPPEWISLIPRDFAVAHEVFPMGRTDETLTVGMVCPLDKPAMDELKTLTGLDIRPVLCSAADIRAAIETYYISNYSQEGGAASSGLSRAVQARRIEYALRIEGIAGLIRKAGCLPPLPKTVQRVRAMMETKEGSPTELARVISMDPAVAARLLGLANSPAYGLAKQVSNVVTAISVLGLSETYNVVLSSDVANAFESCPSFDSDAFWEESLFCAGAATAIARVCNVPRSGTHFTAGLLHDIGRLVLARVVPERYVRVDPFLNFQALLEAERQMCQLSHPEAGYILAESWNLPAGIAQAIRFHHDPALADAPERTTVAIVAIAAALMEQIKGNEMDMFYENQCAEAFALLHLDPAALITIRNQTLAILPDRFK